MNCLEAQKRLHDFLEDILSESVHEEIKEHLSGCALCQQHALRLGTFTSDLKRLGEAELPYDFVPSLLKTLKKRKHIQPVAVQWKAILTPVALFALLGYAIYLGFPRLSELRPPRLGKKEMSDEKKLTLLQLELIDKRLAKVTEGLYSAEGDQGKGAEASRSRHQVLSLRPFHWHLELENLDAQNSLLAKIKELSIQIKYQSPNLLALVMKQEAFDALFKDLREKNLFEKNKVPIDWEKLPQSKNPLELSLILKRKDLKDKSPGALHWHVNFLRKNSYLLYEELMNKEWNFLFDSPELWVLEVTHAQYLELLQLLKSRSATLLSGQPPEVLETPSIRLQIYIQES